MTWIFSEALIRQHGNSHYLQALEAESLEVSCSDGKQSAPSSGTPMQRVYLSPGKTKAFSRLSPFGMMCRLLTEQDGEAVLMWFLEGFPVKTSAAQARAQASMVSDQGCGRTWRELLGKYDHATHSLKTAQCSLLGDLTECLQTLPRSGSMRNGALYQREMLEAVILESECGFSLPTPRANKAMAARITAMTASREFHNLETVLARLMLPTIVANEGKGSGRNRFVGSPHFRGAKMSEGLRTCETDPIYLNPCFVEAMMGWPLWWTDFDALATGRFREWQQQHFCSSGKE